MSNFSPSPTAKGRLRGRKVAGSAHSGQYINVAARIGTLRDTKLECGMRYDVWKGPRTYDLAARILNEEIEHEAWFIELLAFERDGKSVPSGHFRRGEPGEAPYSKNRGFYNP